MQRSKIVYEGAQIRRRGAHDFLAYYDFVCARQDSVPLPAVTMNLDKGMLDFNGDRIKLPDWPPILDSIAINKQLHHVAISSTYQSLGPGDGDRRYFRASMKKKIPTIRSKDMTFKLSKALRDTLTVSTNLKTLQLNGLPLRERDLIVLTKGLAKSVSLENLSLANCPISDEGLEIICQSVKYSTSIRTVDFTGCNLTWRGAEHMANIIKHQGMQRHGTAWAESLRYRQPHFERMTGLRRVTLNCNSLIGDRGAAALANELAEDLWVKAVDLQRCGLSNEGARRLLETLKTNSTLSVLDVRSNPLIDKVLVKTILEKVLMNADGESPEFVWIKPTVVESQRTAGFKRRALPSSSRGKSLSRNAVRKTNSSVIGGSRVLHLKSCSQLRYFPWRTAARAGRQRGLPPGATVVDQSFQGAASVKIIVDSDSEEDDGEEPDIVVEASSPAAQDKITERQFGRLQMELRECRLMLAEERRARLRSETRLKEFELENARLRTANLSLTETLANSSSAPAAFSALEDEAVLESIENSFKKFHAFLDLLKDAGLDQLVSMAGLEKSDFQPLGKPQLSSTLGPPFAATLSRNQHVNMFGDLRTETSLSAKVLSPPPIIPAVVMPTQSPSSSASSCHGDNLLDVTFTQTAKSQVPEVDGEPTVDQRSKPIQKYAGDCMKTHHSQRSHSPHSHSTHSNGSQAYSDASHRSSRLSSKSSIREVISDKVDSDRSLTSPESGRDDIMNRITSLRGLGTQSFSTLF